MLQVQLRYTRTPDQALGAQCNDVEEVTKKFIEQFTQHRCETTNQDVSTRGSSSADEDPRVETS